MGLDDEVKEGANGAKKEGSSLADKAKDAAHELLEKATELKDKATAEGGIVDKAKDKVSDLKAKLDKDGDGDIDALEKAKEAASGLMDKAKGLLHRDKADDKAEGAAGAAGEKPAGTVSDVAPAPSAGTTDRPAGTI
jgi:hypothetical protein